MVNERCLDQESVDPKREEFNELIEHYIKNDGLVGDGGLVIEAFRTVDRADFIENERERKLAYTNDIIDLGEGSSISEPVLVARMMRNLHLTGQEKVLEVGTASGYGAALLSKCAKEVYTIEYNQNLAEKTSGRLKKFDNIHVVIGDGALGISEASPFDVIIITAACRDFPPALAKQLIELGRILAPIGKDPQTLGLTLGIKRYGSIFYSEPITYCHFHPLISEEEGGFSKDYLERLFRIKILLFRAKANAKGKTLEKFLQELRVTVPKLQDFSDKRIIELSQIPPEGFDSLFNHLEALEEEADKEITEA